MAQQSDDSGMISIKPVTLTVNLLMTEAAYERFEASAKQAGWSLSDELSFRFLRTIERESVAEALQRLELWWRGVARRAPSGH